MPSDGFPCRKCLQDGVPPAGLLLHCIRGRLTAGPLVRRGLLMVLLSTSPYTPATDLLDDAYHNSLTRGTAAAKL